jgi:hypothetical protein
MSVNVKNGTPLHGPSLCETCSNAHIQRGYRASEELVLCTANSLDRRVLFSVRECSSYRDKNRQSLYEMEKTAWILQPRGSKRAAGFLPSEEVKDVGREIELTLDERD